MKSKSTRPVAGRVLFAACAAAVLTTAACSSDEKKTDPPPAAPGARTTQATDTAPGTAGPTDASTDRAPTESATTASAQSGAAPTKKVPKILPATVGKWKVAPNAPSGMAPYLPPGARMLSQGIIATTLDVPVFGFDGVPVKGHTACKAQAGVSSSASCAVAFADGYIQLNVGKNATMDDAYELGNALYAAAK